MEDFENVVGGCINESEALSKEYSNLLSKKLAKKNISENELIALIKLAPTSEALDQWLCKSELFIGKEKLISAINEQQDKLCARH